MNRGWRKIWHTQKVAQMRHTRDGQTRFSAWLERGRAHRKNTHKMRCREIKANTDAAVTDGASNYVDEREFVFCSHYTFLRPAELSSAGVTAPQ